MYRSKRIIRKEQDTGPKSGDRQPAHEKGREGGGTRPSGTGKSGTVTIGGSKKGDVYPGPAPGKK